MVSEKTELLFDYYGFPDDTYRYQYPAPGAPAVAQRVQQLLAEAGLPCATDSQRGLDHGAFVPLIPAFPDASTPVLQLSLVAGLDPALHNKVGAALRPLRDEGVLILGSGLSFHNMQAFMKTMGGREDPVTAAKSREFDAHLTDAPIRLAAGQTRSVQRCPTRCASGKGCWWSGGGSHTRSSATRAKSTSRPCLFALGLRARMLAKRSSAALGALPCRPSSLGERSRVVMRFERFKRWQFLGPVHFIKAEPFRSLNRCVT